MTIPYRTGQATALIKLGLNLRSALSPTLGGAMFGGAAGALTAPEGHRGEGALAGTLLGGAGAGAGHLAGKAYGHFGVNKAQKRLDRVRAVSDKARQRAVNRPDSPMLGQYGAYNDSWRGRTLKALDEKALADLGNRLRSQAELTRGGAMLGGVLGAGTGTALTERNQRMTNAQDPYGYRYQYPPA